MYTIGKVYIWQHQTGMYAHLNGSECTVVAEAWQRNIRGLTWETDTPILYKGRWTVMIAFAGDLRPKEPPKGEQLVLDMFKMPEVEPATT